MTTDVNPPLSSLPPFARVAADRADVIETGIPCTGAIGYSNPPFLDPDCGVHGALECSDAWDKPHDASKCGDEGEDCCASPEFAATFEYEDLGEYKMCKSGYVAISKSASECPSSNPKCDSIMGGIGCYGCYMPPCTWTCDETTHDDDYYFYYGAGICHDIVYQSKCGALSRWASQNTELSWGIFYEREIYWKHDCSASMAEILSIEHPLGNLKSLLQTNMILNIIANSFVILLM